MTILVTGAAGFIGYHVSRALMARGEQVLGIDSLNNYYDPKLKEARLAELRKSPGFEFSQINVADRDAVAETIRRYQSITHIVHLAAQAGVRYSFTNPYAYVDANLMGQVVLLEAARKIEGLRHFVYASSSSVYGANTKLPFSEDDPVDRPISLYAASKRSCELLAYSYSHIYRTPATGLRFFTVYGPWGRPDMAAYIFASSIVRGEPIHVFNHGDMSRDFTYVEDIVSGVVAAMDRPPPASVAPAVPHRVFNLGNHRPERLLTMIETIEDLLGRKAKKIMEPMQPGDIAATFADIDLARRELGFEPSTPLKEGLPKFIDWFCAYHRVKRG